MESQAAYFQYWGKAEAVGFHLLVFHSLDVAACSQTLLATLPGRRRRLEKLTGLGADELSGWLTFFCALHDLGKFAEGFQNLRSDLLWTLKGVKHSRKRYEARHDTLGFLLWKKHLRKHLVRQGVAEEAPRRREDGLDRWMGIVTGHHGQPPLAKDVLLKDAFDLEADGAAALAFVNELQSLLAPARQIPSFQSKAIPLASWWLAGLAVVADWLGSNREFFPYHGAPLPLETYWKKACEQAQAAVAAAGLLPEPLAKRFTLADCLPGLSPNEVQPTPLQALAERLPLSTGATLLILEDVTGAGKTEAALLLAQRLMGQDCASGLYVGLPTMATANGMYRRLGPVYRRLYDPDARPSLALAHGRAEMVKDFRASVLPATQDEGPDYGDGTSPAGAECNAWLADSRKKALLAAVGVGTVDQALLAMLRSRHQSLRLLGLMDKILVVDEVHACDDYMRELLKGLLKAQARVGGSAILLSATLPRDQRREFLDAFAGGAGWPTPVMQGTDGEDYPLLTRFDHHGVREEAVATRDSVCRWVMVRHLDKWEAVEEQLAAAVTGGQCACWIRNTVDDARETCERLRGRHPHWAVELFHARYALRDRLDIEDRVLDAFGPKSGPKQRAGRVLIATQVVEQSLDLDFDCLITDLAPIDLIIQRAGRLRRHTRDTDGRRIHGVDQRGIPVIHIHAPAWNETPPRQWASHDFQGTGIIYPDHGRLWLSLKLLRERGGFAMPDHARRLIEGVYGQDSFEAIAPALRDLTLEAEGKGCGERSYAALKVIDLDRGYQADARWADEDAAPTRLGEPTVTLFLARREGASIGPLYPGGQAWEGWAMSSLTVRRALAQREGLPVGVDASRFDAWKAELPGKGRWGLLIALTEEDGGWGGIVEDGRGSRRRLVYDPRWGLRME